MAGWPVSYHIGVSQEDSGYYESVAFDGYHLLKGGEASYFYIIASQRAQLKIIGKFVNDVNHTIYLGTKDWCPTHQ